ncbi:hypothetical protein CF319_g2387 [Tilletia indica]|nr:hypothetical protein CF319_g2387 [Tilletia indica]
MTSTVPAAALDAACSNTFVGHVHVDSVKRRGNSNYYDLECQHATSEGDQIDVVALLYTEKDAPQPDEVWQVSGSWIPTATPFLYIDSFSRVLKAEGDLPDSFEPASPTVCLMCVVTEFVTATGTAVVRTVDFDRRNSKRSAVNANILRPGRRWDKSPPLRVGSFVFVRGIVHSQNEVTRLFNILAESITFLPMVTTSDNTSSPSPKKRKFVRKASGTNVIEDEPTTPVASTSTLPTPEPGLPSSIPALDPRASPSPAPSRARKGKTTAAPLT